LAHIQAPQPANAPKPRYIIFFSVVILLNLFTATNNSISKKLNNQLLCPIRIKKIAKKNTKTANFAISILLFYNYLCENHAIMILHNLKYITNILWVL